MRKFTISESDLTKVIQKAITKKLIEQDFSIEPEVKMTNREKELEKVFGKYSGEIPADIIRYMRKNPKLIITRLLDIYGEKMVNYMINKITGSIEIEDESDIDDIMEQVNDDDFEDYEEEEDETLKYPIDDFNFELSDSDMLDIYDYKGSTRRFRGSIYIDGLVPETDDKEYDREVAKKMMEYYRKQIENQESYVGGVGFRQRDISRPYDNMDF
jgi:hypothetical protein